jgi:hypothetical protein
MVVTIPLALVSFELWTGVVPVCAAHLDGAVQLNLKGIYHSINVPEQWYGSDGVIDQWHTEMLRQIEQQTAKRGTGGPLSAFFSRK